MKRAALILVFCCTPGICPAHVLDSLDDIGNWQVQHTDDVSASINSVAGKAGKALGLDFDFTDTHGNPINGYATARRALPLDLPENFELSFWIRGKAPVNNLQFKLVDASGENVWWVNMPDYIVPNEWQEIRIKKRQIEFAWGPATDRTLKHIASIEFVVSSGRDGGKGTVEFDDLELRTLPPPDATALHPQLHASSSLAGFPASAAMDGNRATAWRSDPRKGAKQQLDIDLGRAVEFSGVILHWRHGERATNLDIRQSIDGKNWHACYGIAAHNGDDDFDDLCDSEARYLRLELRAGEGKSYGLEEVEIKDPAWATTRNAFYANVAKVFPRGTFPRGFTEQPYWTIVGVDGGAAPALISEDGAIEPRKGGYSIEPFLVVDGRTLSWADVNSTQTLADSYLPIPSVTWHTDKIELDIETFASGTRESARLIARYLLRNTTDTAIDATLKLAIRPFQVNPPAQFLNSPGGVSSIQSLHWHDRVVSVDGSEISLSKAPDTFELLRPEGSVIPSPASNTMYDAFGLASGALVYKLHLAAHEESEIDVSAPTSESGGGRDIDPAWVAHERDAVAADWRAKLDRVRLHVPPAGQRIADALRSAHAQILMSRDGRALRPGTRSYARSWIRDGAMIADGLLRLGDLEAVRDYVDWYAPHQFANGKVPCCVDHRGSDPVPENDSHGELIHAIAQLYRYGGDRAELEKQWPHIDAAITYMDGLRASETGAANAAFKGLMPASISHEGYSAKPMHSYWDDFWALTGYKDAADMARILGVADAARIAQSRDAFRRDLLASIALAVKAHAITFIPGCSELGDFDATSTTVALSPAGEQANLPQKLLADTFEQYWNNFAARADGSKTWIGYTPYEWRTVGSFVRLGWRERAQAALDFFFANGARPRGWNQWAEVVGRDERQIRFIGDMPHAWVASDFIRSALDLFAYERDSDRSLVLAAGIPVAWFAGEGVGIERLRTPYGMLSYTLRQTGNRLMLHVAAGVVAPGGVVVPIPQGMQAGAVRVNGKVAKLTDGELRIDGLPADAVVDLTQDRSTGEAHAH